MSSVDVILYPSDFSEECEQAFPLACSLARGQFASLIVAHVLPDECALDGSLTTDLVDEQHPLFHNCRDQFQRLNALAIDIPIYFRVKAGHPIRAILDIAQEEEADLIVLASHQHGSFQAELHRNIASGLLQRTHCPVMILKQPTTNVSTANPSPT